ARTVLPPVPDLHETPQIPGVRLVALGSDNSFGNDGAGVEISVPDRLVVALQPDRSRRRPHRKIPAVSLIPDAVPIAFIAGAVPYHREGTRPASAQHLDAESLQTVVLGRGRRGRDSVRDHRNIPVVAALVLSP